MISNCFYYGGYTPEGYYSLAAKPTFYAGRNYAVKSCRPSVKQRFFDRISAELENRGHDFTLFRTDCGNDGVFSKASDLRIVDGTYGAFDEEVFIPIDLDGEIIEYAQPILKKRDEAVKRAVRFLSACQCILGDMSRLDSANIDIAKVNRFSSRLWSQTGGSMKGTVGTEHKRFVSCFTSDGVELDTSAFDNYCDRVTVICDRTGVCARRITDRVRRYALSAGYDIISCICPMNPELGAEHIIIPELRYGIFVNKFYHKADFPQGRKTFSARFMLDSTESKNRMDFSFKAYKRLMQEVFYSLEVVEYCDSELDKIEANENTDEIVSNVLHKFFSY